MAKSTKARLEKTYHQLLKQHGLQLPDEPPDKRDIMAQLMTEAKQNADGHYLKALFSSDMLERFMRYDRLLQSVLDKASREIETDIKQSGLSSEDPVVFVGEFPIGEFNAGVKPVSGGALILFNTGLAMFLYAAVQILVWFMVSVARKQSKYSLEDIVSALTEQVLAYLRFPTRLTTFRSLPFQGGAEQLLGAVAMESCCKFVLTHEYAHVIAGHLTSPRIVIRTAVGDLELMAKRRQQELEADALAIQIMRKSLEREKLRGHTFAASLAAGPLIFFALDELVSRARKELFGTPKTSFHSHPPSSERSAFVRSLLKQNGGDRLLELGDIYVSWLSAMTEHVIRLIRLRQQL